MNYLSAVKSRLIAVLKLTVPPEGVKLSFPDVTPPAKQEWEGYVIAIRGMRGTQSWQSLEQRPSKDVWEVVILGRHVGLGNRYVNEDTILQVADAVSEQINYRNRLQNASGQPLDSVDSVQIVGRAYQAPTDYPVGQSQNQYYTVSIQVQVEYIWMKGATPCQ